MGCVHVMRGQVSCHHTSANHPKRADNNGFSPLFVQQMKPENTGFTDSKPLLPKRHP